MKTSVLLIRADGTQQIGTGHVMRCLALAQVWQMSTGGAVVFVMASDAPALETRLRAEDAQVVRLATAPGSAEDAKQTAACALKCHASWVVIDGYHFDTEYQRILKGAGLQLLVIDDYSHAEYYDADMILNQNLHAQEQLYVHRQPQGRLLLGSRYLLLRQEFLQQGPPVRTTQAVARRVLVTLGGSDPENVTAKVIQALQHEQCKEVEGTVIIGGSNPHAQHLHDLLNNASASIELKHNVTDIREEMKRADLAISAAGSTAWELAYMGLPSLLIVVAENQRPIAAHLAQAGAAIDLGWHSTCSTSDIAQGVEQLRASATARQTMSQRGQTLIDGNGASRVVMAMTGDRLYLRSACESDCRVLWEWANDPEARAVSFSSALIPWPEHLKWFHGKIGNPQCRFFIAADSDDVPVGQVRYDLGNDEATISVSLDHHQRSKGYGSLLLRLSAHALFTTTQTTMIHAYVKPDNHASVRVFSKAGYTSNGLTTTAGQPAVHFTLRRSL